MVFSVPISQQTESPVQNIKELMKKFALKMLISLNVLACGVCSSIAADPADLAKTWEYQGDVTFVQDMASNQIRFKIQVCEDGRWHGQFCSGGDEFENGSELSWDRTNLFILAHHAGGSSTLAGGSVRYEESGHIYRKSFAIQFNNETGSVWWLLCSPYVLGFNGETNCPSFLACANAEKVFCRHVTTNSQALGLQEGEMYSVRPQAADEHPFCRLRVTKWGNIDGAVYPSEAEFEQLYVAKLDLNGEPKRLSLCTIRCQPPQPIQAPSNFAPKIDQLASIVDVRAQGVKMQYIGKEWMAEDQVSTLLQAGKAVSLHEPDKVKVPSRARWWVIGVLACVGCGFLYRVFRPKSIRSEM